MYIWYKFVTQNECGEKTEKFEIDHLPFVTQYPNQSGVQVNLNIILLQSFDIFINFKMKDIISQNMRLQQVQYMLVFFFCIIFLSDFLIDNIFFTFGRRVFQQTVGIPMGTSCRLVSLLL